jgi:hypothetical protein
LHAAGKGGVHFIFGVEQAKAVGAKQRHLVALAEICDPALNIRALWSCFLEAGADHNDCLGLGSKAIPHCFQHQTAGQGDDAEVDFSLSS